MLSKQKVDYLMSVNDNQDELINKAKLLEVTDGNHADVLTFLIPRNETTIKCTSSNSALVTFIVKLFQPLHMLRDYLNS